jgi:hypothetical protein
MSVNGTDPIFDNIDLESLLNTVNGTTTTTATPTKASRKSSGASGAGVKTVRPLPKAPAPLSADLFSEDEDGSPEQDTSALITEIFQSPTAADARREDLFHRITSSDNLMGIHGTVTKFSSHNNSFMTYNSSLTSTPALLHEYHDISPPGLSVMDSLLTHTDDDIGLHFSMFPSPPPITSPDPDSVSLLIVNNINPLVQLEPSPTKAIDISTNSSIRADDNNPAMMSATPVAMDDDFLDDVQWSNPSNGSRNHIIMIQDTSYSGIDILIGHNDGRATPTTNEVPAPTSNSVVKSSPLRGVSTIINHVSPAGTPKVVSEASIGSATRKRTSQRRSKKSETDLQALDSTARQTVLSPTIITAQMSKMPFHLIRWR